MQARHAAGDLNQGITAGRRLAERVAQGGEVAQRNGERRLGYHFERAQQVAELQFEGVQHLKRCPMVRQGNKHALCRLVDAFELKCRRRNDPEGAAGADKHLLEVEPGIVLAQRREQLHHGAVAIGQHHLDAEQVMAQVAMLEQAAATGIGADQSAYRRIATDIDREAQRMGLQLAIQLRQEHASVDNDRAVQGINLAHSA